MISVIRCALTGFLSFVFTAAGIHKVMDLPGVDIHEEMLAKFPTYSPLLAPYLGFEPNPVLYMNMIGVLELLAAPVLAFGRPRPQRLAIILLMVLMAGAVWTHVMLSEPVVVPSVLLGLLCLRLWLGTACDDDGKQKED